MTTVKRNNGYLGSAVNAIADVSTCIFAAAKAVLWHEYFANSDMAHEEHIEQR
jgi:hypothetical protein